MKSEASPIFPLSLRFWSWLGQHCPFLLRGISVPYAGVMGCRRFLYRHGWIRQRVLPKPVFSVGNLTLGGVGKTPLVMWLTKWLQRRGLKVAILSRGYGRTCSSQTILVSDGSPLLTDWRLVGDEPLLMAKKCPGVVVAVGNNRYELGEWVLKRVECDCFVLDDGFQHLSLARACDLVAFDMTDIQGIGGVFPFGRLREPLSAVKGVEGIVFTRMETPLLASKLQKNLETIRGEALCPIKMKTRLSRLIHISTGKIEELNALTGERILIVSGIGNPSAFKENMMALGCQIVEDIRYPDHFVYGSEDVEHIREKYKRIGVTKVITTEKDAVRIHEWLQDDDPFWAVEMELDMISPDKIIEDLFEEFLIAPVDVRD